MSKKEQDTDKENKEVLTLGGVVKSLKNNKQLTFEDWLKNNNYEIKENRFIKNNKLHSKKRLQNKYIQYVYKYIQAL